MKCYDIDSLRFMLSKLNSCQEPMIFGWLMNSNNHSSAAKMVSFNPILVQSCELINVFDLI